MDILKIATAGNVDDGKSTLIGRLLHDTNSVTKDKLESIVSISKNKGLGFVDLSLLTDGLLAEIEQGITIDVAHIYFSTDTRKYIIADSPGHFEYTRNMITGASNANVFIVLIDAVNGVTEQTRRHLFIASLLRIETVIVCINKMDLVSYSEETFITLKEQIEQLIKLIDFEGRVTFIPVAAKHGDNVVSRSLNLNWYNGRSLLEYVEAIPVHQKDVTLPDRFAVQMKIFDGTSHLPAGKMLSGTLRTGQLITVLPSQKKSVIKTIWHSNQEVEVAAAGQSVTIELHDNTEINRGSMIIASKESLDPVNKFLATVCWLNEQPLIPNKGYILQHGINRVNAKFTDTHYTLNIHTLEHLAPIRAVHSNDIAGVTINTDTPIFADVYRKNPANGAFILIDAHTNSTVAVGFIESV